MDNTAQILSRLEHIEYNELPHIWGTLRRIERILYALVGLLVGIGVLEVATWVR